MKKLEDYPEFMREGLIDNGWKDGFTKWSDEEVFRCWLSWEGIFGGTMHRQIIEAARACLISPINVIAVQPEVSDHRIDMRPMKTCHNKRFMRGMYQRCGRQVPADHKGMCPFCEGPEDEIYV